MQNFDIGDLVLVIKSDYYPNLIGQAGIVAITARTVTGTDKFGNSLTDRYVIVDLPDEINRFGTTLWYFKPHYLLKILPDHEDVVTNQVRFLTYNFTDMIFTIR